jgi:hypothetical protein
MKVVLPQQPHSFRLATIRELGFVPSLQGRFSALIRR